MTDSYCQFNKTDLSCISGPRTKPPPDITPGQKLPRQKPPGQKPSCQKPPGQTPRQNILFRNFITFVLE